jgi:tetratricopeptide (TPR) repeat protein
LTDFGSVRKAAVEIGKTEDGRRAGAVDHVDKGDVMVGMSLWCRCRAAVSFVPWLAARAALAHEEGDPTSALHLLGTAIDADPSDASLRYNRAFVHQDLGAWDQALVDLRAAAELAPDDEEVAEALSLCASRVAAVS